MDARPMRVLYRSAESLAYSPTQICKLVKGDDAWEDLVDDQSCQYDYIIIGGGTAGSVIASRLAESMNKPSILVLEAGSRINDYLSSIPLIAMLRGQSEKYCYKVETTKQKGMAGRSVEMLAGRLVGGSSAINVGVYTRGPNCELDEWESKYGCQGWNHEVMQQYLDIPFGHDMSSTEDGGSANTNKGPWQYSYGKSHQYSMTERVLSTLDSRGLGRYDRDPYTSDEKRGPIGSGCFTIQSATTRDGKKVHAGNAYLTDEILRGRPNLKICTKAKAVKLIFDKTEDNEDLRATGVFFIDDKGNKYYASAKGRVILCAGVLHTPHLLLKSGIGPSSDLKRYKIPQLLESPQIGLNFQDHVGVPLHFLIPYSMSSINISDGVYAIPAIIKNIYKYFFNGGNGFFASPSFIEASGWFNTDDLQYRRRESSKEGHDDDLVIECKDPHSTIPNIELLFSTYWLEWAQTRYQGLDDNRYTDPKGIMGIYVILTQPKSTGSVGIASDGGVKLDPGYLSDNLGQDLKTLQKGIKFAVQIASNLQNAFKISPASIPGWDSKQGKYSDANTRLQIGSAFAHPDEISDEMYEIFIKEKATPIYHGTSTCKMGDNPSTSAVNSTTMNLWGTSNLTIFDTSVFPKVNATHPQSLVFAGAERVAHLISKTDSLIS